MHIDQLWVYPVKSLRGTSLPSAHLFRDGFKHDRRFMLLKVHHDDPSSPTKQRLENMHIGAGFPEMALFTAVLNPAKESLRVECNPPGGAADSIEVPLSPNWKGLEKVPVVMHKSPTTGYDMGSKFNSWFSKNFGFEVIFAYLSDTDRRPVLGNVSPTAAAKGTSVQPPSPSEYTTLLSYFMSNQYLGPLVLISTSYLLLLAATHLLKGSTASDFPPIRFTPSGTPQLNITPASIFLTSTSTLTLLGLLLSITTSTFSTKDPGITFADVAPYLVVTTTSLASASSLLPAHEEMDIRKFRPNIILADAPSAWDEDYWAQLSIIPDNIDIVLTQNCARCASINVDFATGKPGTTESGTILKKLMKDRRVDKGTKFSPVFGRYGFVMGKGDGKLVRVGDEVKVTKRNEERTAFAWPGLTN